MPQAMWHVVQLIWYWHINVTYLVYLKTLSRHRPRILRKRKWSNNSGIRMFLLQILKQKTLKNLRNMRFSQFLSATTYKSISLRSSLDDRKNLDVLKIGELTMYQFLSSFPKEILNKLQMDNLNFDSISKIETMTKRSQISQLAMCKPDNY